MRFYCQQPDGTGGEGWTWNRKHPYGPKTWRRGKHFQNHLLLQLLPSTALGHWWIQRQGRPSDSTYSKFSSPLPGITQCMDHETYIGRITEDQAEGLREVVCSTSCLKPGLTMTMAPLKQAWLARAKPARKEITVMGRGSCDDHWAEALGLLFPSPAVWTRKSGK